MTYVLRTTTGLFYNGKAGSAWVSADKADAFAYSEELARRTAERFNRMTALHGLTFEVVTNA